MEWTINTSCPFPVIKLTAGVEYSEVQKPSGIGYIILTLIRDASDEEEIFSDTLGRFGVPDDLRSIFADEIEVMIARDILRMRRNSEYRSDYFEDYRIMDFEFTEDGERMFRDGAIPTGKKGYKEQTVFFNPLKSEFSFNAPNNLLTEEQQKCYPKGFMDDIDIDESDLKDHLIENIKTLKLQDEERVTDCEIKNRVSQFIRTDGNLKLHIDMDGMAVELNTGGAESFYKNHFQPDMLERELSSKDMFRFNIPTKSVIGLSDFKRISYVYPPANLEKQRPESVRLLITRNGGDVKIKSDKKEIISNNRGLSSAINEEHPEWSFIAVNVKDIKCYTAADVKLDEHTLGKPIALNLLVEEICSNELRTNILEEIFNECSTNMFNEDSCKLIKALSELMENPDITKEYVEQKLDSEKDIMKHPAILLTATGVFSGMIWTAFAKERANAIHDNLISKLTTDNVGSVVRAVKTLDPIVNPEEGALFTLVATKLGEMVNDTIERFRILTEAGFNENESLSAANAVKVYMGTILSGEQEFKESRISNGFRALANDLNTLKTDLNIKSTVNYAFPEEYDIDGFIIKFKALREKLSTLKTKYGPFAKSEFEQIAKYEEVMQPVLESITAERNALKDPGKITEKYIRDLMQKGRLREAVIDMFIRLELTLNDIMEIGKNVNIKAYKLIDDAVSKNIVTADDGKTLHELRNFRNNIQHPKSEKIDLKEKDVSRWADVVFIVLRKNEERKGTKK